MAKVFGMNMKLKAKMNNEDAQKRNLIKRKEKTTEKQEQWQHLVWVTRGDTEKRKVTDGSQFTRI